LGPEQITKLQPGERGVRFSIEIKHPLFRKNNDV
jgi:hypothetical protein